MAHYAILQVHTDLQLHRNERIRGKGLCHATLGRAFPLPLGPGKGCYLQFVCAIPSTKVVFTHPREEDILTLHLPLQRAVLISCWKETERPFFKVPLEAELAVG